jgi:hypothetical protein
MRGQRERERETDKDREGEKRTRTINMTCRNFPNGSLHIQVQSEGPWMRRKGESGRAMGQAGYFSFPV